MSNLKRNSSIGNVNLSNYKTVKNLNLKYTTTNVENVSHCSNLQVTTHFCKLMNPFISTLSHITAPALNKHQKC